MREPFRVGDVLTVSCAFTEAAVAHRAAASVAAATGTGSIEDDIVRWREVTGAEPLRIALPGR